MPYNIIQITRPIYGVDDLDIHSEKIAKKIRESLNKKDAIIIAFDFSNNYSSIKKATIHESDLERVIHVPITHREELYEKIFNLGKNYMYEKLHIFIIDDFNSLIIE